MSLNFLLSKFRFRFYNYYYFYLKIKGLNENVPLLSGGTQRFSITCPEFMTSDNRINGHGMPISKSPGNFGDLIVRTNINIPDKNQISPSAAQLLQQVL